MKSVRTWTIVLVVAGVLIGIGITWLPGVSVALCSDAKLAGKCEVFEGAVFGGLPVLILINMLAWIALVVWWRRSKRPTPGV